MEFSAAKFFDDCVCLGLHRAARTTARRYDKALKSAGLTSGQFSILAALQREEAVPIGILARLLAMDRTTLNRNLQPLETIRLIESQPAQTDRRVRTITCTLEGQNRFETAFPYWHAAQTESRKLIGAETAWTIVKPVLDGLSVAV